MRSRILLKDNGGFTLFEILVVMGLILIIGSFSLYFGIDRLRGYSFHGDRDDLVALLEHARALSVTNICYGNPCMESTPHGVSIQPRAFVLFQGQNYSSADHTYDVAIDRSPDVEENGLSEVVFAQLSGNVLTPGTITLTDQSTLKTSLISTEDEGRIVWTN
jgi:prepilin-type N-terminal cleavage/methylation domain-containing protein